MKKVFTLAFLLGNLAILWTGCEKASSNPTGNNTTTYNGVVYDNTNGLSVDNTSLFDFRDSNVYAIVQIDNKCWMAENLRYNASGGWINPSNPSTSYGRLYDWATAMNGSNSSSVSPSGVQGICPSSWHLPSDSEWSTLEVALGMNTSNVTITGYRGGHGTVMKSTTGWNNSGNGTNSSGFNGFPAGDYYSGFNHLGGDALFLSCTEFSPAYAWYRSLTHGNSSVNRGYADKIGGVSCRCIKD